VQSLERGLAVLRAFDGDHGALTLSDVARVTGLTRATARRLLLTFVALGYMRCDERRFSLTPKVLDIGHSYVSSLQLADIAQPFMEAMSERVHESVSCAVLDGEEIVYVARVPTTRIMTISLALGSRLPAFCTSMGKVLLAYLPTHDRDALLDRIELRQRGPNTLTGRRALVAELRRVRAQGFAINNEELAFGLRSIAAPVFSQSGEIAAAINLAVHSSMVVSMEELVARLSGPLKRTATEISARVGHRPASTPQAVLR